LQNVPASSLVQDLGNVDALLLTFEARRLRELIGAHVGVDLQR